MVDHRDRPPRAVGIVRLPRPAAFRESLLAGLALVGVAVVAISVLVGREGPAPAPAPTAAGQATAASAVDVLELPTRGSLAGDAAFLDGVLRRSWETPESTVGPGIPDAPVETRRVVFAGDVPSGRWALVVGANALVPDVPPRSGGADGDHLAAAWFGGPPGATPEQMTLRTVPRGVLPEQPTALVDPAGGALVVVAAPGDVVEVSDHPDVSAQAIALRNYRRVPTDDGVAVVALTPNDLLMTAVSYRVLRGGVEVVRTKPEPYPPRPPLPAPVDFRRGVPSAAGQEVARRAATQVLARLGLPRAEVRVTAEWVGELPGPGATSGPAAVVTIQVPSGAVIVAADWDLRTSDGGGADTRCSLAIEPAGHPVDRRVHAVSCAAYDAPRDFPVPTALIVVGPPPVTAIRAHDRRSTLLAEHPATDGVAVLPYPAGTATVEAVTGAGVSLGRWRLLGQVADFGS